MPNPSTPAQRRVDKWLRDESTAYPDGVEGFVSDEDGMQLVLTEPVQIDALVDILQSREEEEGEQYEAERIETEEEYGVSFLQVEETERILHKHKVGSTYYEDEKFPLGGSSNPITTSGKPTDDTVEETLSHLVAYLDS